MQRVNWRTLKLSIAVAACCVCFSATSALASEKPTVTINGEITSVDGVRLLRVWGDAEARGYAHGYLMADDIIKLFNAYIETPSLSGGPQQYETLRGRMIQIMALPPAAQDELTGMLRGINARKGGAATVAALGRAFEYEDLVAMNCIPDAAGVACSSFAAWGALTPDGDTIAGRNLDWYPASFMIDSQILIAHIPQEKSPRNAWLSISWPGMVICLTGMNEHGISVSMHDVFQTRPTSRSGFTPRGYCLREAIERVAPDDVAGSILNVLRDHQPMVGNNVPVSFPSQSGKAAAAIFEYDGNKKHDQGVTVRQVDANGDKPADYLIATNDYRKRRAIAHCGRFEYLQDTLGATSKSEDSSTPKVTVDAAFEHLRQVSITGNYLTYQSVVFEPNKRRLTIKLAGDGKAAPGRQAIRVDVAEVLKRPVSTQTSKQ